jgi:hypothetical protein
MRSAEISGGSVIARRYVITGPPNSGKSTWVQCHAQVDDLVFDFDEIAATMTGRGVDQGRDENGHRPSYPWATKAALIVMRDALIEWLSRTELSTTEIYLIITNPRHAESVADRIGATVIQTPRRLVVQPDSTRSPKARNP